MAMFSDAVINLFFNADKATKDIEKFKAKTKSSFSSVAGGIIKGGVALGAAYFGVKALKDVYDGMLNVVNVADKWGRSSEEISRFSNTLSLFGGNSEEAIQAIDKIEDAIASLKTQGGGAIKDLSGKIALNIQKQNGEFKNSSELIEDLRVELSRLSSAGKIKALQELGLASPAMLRLLTASNEEYAKMKKNAQSFSVINKDNARQLKAIDRTIATMTNLFQSLLGEVFGTLSPFFDEVLPQIKIIGSSIASIIRSLMPVLKFIAKIASLTISSISEFLDGLINLDFSKMFDSIKNFFLGFGELLVNFIADGLGQGFKKLGAFGRFIGRKLGISSDATAQTKPQSLVPEISKKSVYASHGDFAASSVNPKHQSDARATFSNRTLQIGNIVVNGATDAFDFGQKLVNTLNNQTASNLAY